MLTRGRWKKIPLYLVTLLLLVCEPNLAQSLTQKQILEKIARLAAQTKTTLGVTAIHIERNETISYNGQKPFIMASTVKLPIAVVLLHDIDAKKGSLDEVVQIKSDSLVPGSGNLYQYFRKNILHMSLRNLLKHMMTRSDNTATDAVLKHLNGPPTVLAKLKAFGLYHIKINRTIMQLFIATNDVAHMSLKKPHHLRRWENIFNGIPLSKKTTAWKIFQDDSRDTTTADDMALLLKNLYQRRLISATHTEYLLSLMEKCETGQHRIKALLPPHIKVAHKTGTWAIYSKKFLRYPAAKNLFRFAGDVGIITLPQNKGHIAIAIYVKSTAASNMQREKVIAEVARDIFTYFNEMNRDDNKNN